MSHSRRRFDLVVFDVDGTLVEHDHDKTVWEVLNRHYTGDDGMNKERLQAYQDGRLSYAEWVALDVEGWRAAGATRTGMVRVIRGALRVVPGTHETLARLKQSGCRLVAISGTLDLLLDTLLPEHPFDETYCNRLGFDDQQRIASWTATPFDMQGKQVALRAVATREGIPLSRCAFVGDSSNDLWIARVAGFALAFNPKTAELERAADAVVRSRDLRDILPHLL